MHSSVQSRSKTWRNDESRHASGSRDSQHLRCACNFRGFNENAAMTSALAVTRTQTLLAADIRDKKEKENIREQQRTSHDKHRRHRR